MAIVHGKDTLKQSTTGYHWLGSGTYFWELDEVRAMEWAKGRPGKRKLNDPCVVGAIIDMRNCLDLRTRQGNDLVKQAYELLLHETTITGLQMPENQVAASDKSPDKVLRYLDFAVIDRLHRMMEDDGQEPFDTVRALFHEGAELYAGSGFHEKTHSEIAVRNDDCLIGFFLPRD